MLDVPKQELKQRLKDLREQLLTIEISEEDKRIKKVCEEFGSNHFTKEEEAILKEIEEIEDKIFNLQQERDSKRLNLVNREILVLDLLERKGSLARDQIQKETRIPSNILGDVILEMLKEGKIAFNLIDYTFSKGEKEMDAAENKSSWLKNLYAEKNEIENTLKETVKDSEKKHVKKKLESVKEKISEIESQKDLIENMADSDWTQNLSDDDLIRWGDDAISFEKEHLPSLKERYKRLFENLETASGILNFLERSHARECQCEYMRKQIDLLNTSAKALKLQIDEMEQERKEKINEYLSIPSFVIEDALAFSFCEYMKSEGTFFEKSAVNKKLTDYLKELLSDLDDKEWNKFCKNFSINLWKKMQSERFAEVQIGRKGGLNYHMMTLTKKGIDAAKANFAFDFSFLPVQQKS